MATLISSPKNAMQTEARLKLSIELAPLRAARLAIDEGRLNDAEGILRGFLRTVDAYDPVAIQMLADIGIRLGYYENAEQLLLKVVELMPSWLEARYDLALSIYKQNRISDALLHIESLIETAPKNIDFHILKAEILINISEYEAGVKEYETILELDPSLEFMWLFYADNLRVLGRLPQAIVAYHRALVLKPEFGEVWWSLANLKTYVFTQDEISTMQTALLSPSLTLDNRTNLEFALGKAAEDAKNYSKAFSHYESGNRLRHDELPYDASTLQTHIDKSIELFTKPFFAERSGEGHKARDPIFIIGMHRAGSTLIEQILASHSDVEGTFELDDLQILIRQWTSEEARIDKLTGEGLDFIGRQYIERTQIQRKSDKPHFVDKFPSNWQHVPFIHMVLPNAIIIDARRHPMACCFSNYKQYYATGHAASYDLASMGHQYANYVRLMRHVDEVLPNRVYRVIHERLVDDPEGEIRKLLEACNLSFDPSCLNFHENRRAVRTPSAEQVRRPIYREGMEAWQHFEPWLGPLKAELGDLIDTYQV